MKIKKIISVALAGAMIIGMSSFAMAAPSITAVLDTNSVKASQGEVAISKEVDTTDLPEEGKKGVEALKEAEKGTPLADAFEKTGLDVTKIPVKSDLTGTTAKEIKAEDLKVLAPVCDMKITGAEPTEEKPVDVTFTVNNLTDDVDVYALHLCETHSWELLEPKADAAASKNQIVIPFHSASPVALVYVDKTVTPEVTTAPTK